jgi:hypothetical protein
MRADYVIQDMAGDTAYVTVAVGELRFGFDVDLIHVADRGALDAIVIEKLDQQARPIPPARIQLSRGQALDVGIPVELETRIAAGGRR